MESTRKWLQIAEENRLSYPVIDLLLQTRDKFFTLGYSTQFIVNQIRKIEKELGLI